MHTNRKLAPTKPADLLSAIQIIREADGPATVFLYGIEFVLENFPMPRTPHGCFLTTKDSDPHGYNKVEERRAGTEYSDYVHHLRTGSDIGRGVAVFRDREAMIEAITSGNCSLSGS